MMPTDDMARTVSLAALASFIVSSLIVLTQRWHGKLSLDKDVNGIQKFHKVPVPRVGGIALLVGILTVVLISAVDVRKTINLESSEVWSLLVASTPAFLAGVAEDVTKKISVKLRLVATFASALLACWLLDAYLEHLDTWGLDTLLQLSPLIAIAITAFAVAGVTNSINMIDGFHGVAGSAIMIMLAGMGFLSWRVGDVYVTNLALLGIGATIGFMCVNYPTGRLFMGDGGAYLLGFWLAEVAVLLAIRNPEINAWQILTICAYPVSEALYSIFRRKVIRKSSPGAPDRLHLHTLIYRRVICQIIPRNNELPWVRNAGVACVVALWIAVLAMVTVLVGDTISSAVTVLVVNSLLYIAVYTRLVRGHWRMKLPATLGLFRSRPAIRELP